MASTFCRLLHCSDLNEPPQVLSDLERLPTMHTNLGPRSFTLYEYSGCGLVHSIMDPFVSHKCFIHFEANLQLSSQNITSAPFSTAPMMAFVHSL